MRLVDAYKDKCILYVIIDEGKLYTTYPNFVKHYAPAFAELYAYKMSYINPEKNLFRIITSGYHLNYNSVLIHIIQNVYTNRVYLIGEGGIKRKED